MITRLISEKAIPEFLLRMYSSITDWKSASVYSRYAFLRETDPDLDEMWFPSLQLLEEPEELVQVLASGLSELAHFEASNGARET